MQVTFDLTPEDLWQWNLYYRRHKHYMRPIILAAWLGTLGIILACQLLVLALSLLRHQPVSWRLLLYIPVVIWFAYKYIPPSRKRLTKLYARDPGQFCSHTVVISPAWIEETTPVRHNKQAWSLLTSIEEDAQHLYFCVSRVGAYVIPKRAFSGPNEAEMFLNTARRYWEAAKNGTPVAAEVAVWPPPPQAR